MNSTQIITFLNSLTVGEVESIAAKLDEAMTACRELGQEDLAERLGQAREALRKADVKAYRKHVEAVVSKLGHVK
jgi:hypothetical protein